MQSFFPTVLLFCFAPILALANGLTQLRSLMSRNLIWLFCGFYGLAFYMGSADGTDSTRYADSLVAMNRSTMSFESLRSAFYQEGEHFYDIYQPLTTFMVSRFTDDYRVLFGLFGLVIGYFYSRILGFFVDQCFNRMGFLEYGLLGSLAFVMDVGSAINGVRMYTALFVFIYGFLYFWQSKNPVYFLVACMSVLVHFSFIIPVAIFLVLPTVHRLPWMIYAVFLSSFVIATIDIAAIRNWVESLPLGVESRVAGYLTGTEGADGTPRILMIIDWMTKIFRIVACSYLLIINRSDTSRDLPLVIFAMALNTVVNVLGEVGSMGRFIFVCQILIIGQLLLHANRSLNRDAKVISAGIGSFALLGSLLGFRYFLGFASNNLLVANPFTIWFFDEPGYSLYEYMPKVLTGL